MEDKTVWRVAVGAFCLWVIWFLHPFLAKRMLIPWGPEVVGQWGDSFGALNALMSTLAFAAVFFTLRLQQRQINDAQRDQHLQRFDDTFFRLLTLLREVRSELRFTRNTVEKPKEAIGARALRDAANDATWYLIDGTPVDRNLTREEIAAIYGEQVYKRGETGLGPYFRLVYTILRRVDSDQHLSESEKITYANLLRGQLGSPEIALLALNGLAPISKDLSHYLTKYRMLRYLPMTKVIGQHIEPHYEPAAFQPRND